MSSVPAAGIDSRRGWFAVVAGFWALAVAFGVAYSFGAFVVPLSQALNAAKSEIGWVFSIASFLFLSLGLVTGPISDRFGPRYLVLAAGIFIGGGLVATGYVADVREAYVTYGLCVGIGVSCVFVPVVSNVGAWFTKHRAKALGIAVSGAGLGTVCGAPVAAAAIDVYGWRTAATGLGAIAGLFLAAIALFIPKAPVMGSQRSPWRIADVVRNREFLLVYASGITTGLVLYVAVVFLAPYAIHHGIPNVQAAALVGGIGIASTASRLIFGGVGDRLGVIRTFKLGNALLAVSYAIWLASGSYWLLFAASLVLGAGYGALVALTPAVLMAYFGRERIGAVMGALYTSTSFGALAGTPIAGLIIGSNSNYQAAIWVFFVVAVFGAAVVTLLRPLTAAAGANAVARS